MRQLSDRQFWVLCYLAEQPAGEWVSPTKIGEAARLRQLHGNIYGSPWASPKCKALVNRRLAERSPVGHYRVTDQVREAIESGRFPLPTAAGGAE